MIVGLLVSEDRQRLGWRVSCPIELPMNLVAWTP
jgi:hypothetical protein